MIVNHAKALAMLLHTSALPRIPLLTWRKSSAESVAFVMLFLLANEARHAGLVLRDDLQLQSKYVCIATALPGMCISTVC